MNRATAVVDINRKIDQAIKREKPIGTGHADPMRYQTDVQRMFDLLNAGHTTEHQEIREQAANVAATEAAFEIR